MTGWKIGYAVGPADLTTALRAVHQFVTFASATPFQEAMAIALEVAAVSDYYPELRRDYEARRKLLADRLERVGLARVSDRWQLFPDGDLDGLGFATDVEFCIWLVRETGVVALPPSAFYVDPTTAPLHARFCFAKKLDTLAEAGRRLAPLPDLLEARN